MSATVNMPSGNAEPGKRRPTRIALAALLFLVLSGVTLYLACRWYSDELAPLTWALLILALTCTVVALYLCKRRGIQHNDAVYSLAACTLIGSILAYLMFGPVLTIHIRSHRMLVSNQFKAILNAMHEYSDANPERRFPPAASRDKTGQPLLSWRVLLLPRLGYQDLYDRFHLDEPWDSPHNLQLLPLMPEVYRIATRSDPPNTTAIQVFVGPGTPFEIVEGPILPQDFPDGSSNTLLIAEASCAVLWTKPEDIEYAPNGPLPPLGDTRSRVWPSFLRRRNDSYFHVGFADGTIRYVGRQIREDSLRDAITRNDGKPLGEDW